MRPTGSMRNSTFLKNAMALRNILKTLPLPTFLNPLDTWRQLLIWFVILCGTALAIIIIIDLRRDMGSPDTVSILVNSICISTSLGIAEEILFRGISKYLLGNVGLVIGSLCWVILHQFYAAYRTPFRLPSDFLIGVFYVKLWRGSLWWLALIIHPLLNVAIILGWQLAKMYLL